MTSSPLRLTFDGGTVVVTGGRDEDRADLPGVAFDPRTRTQRAEGRIYRAVVEHLRAARSPTRTTPATTRPTPGPCPSGRDPVPAPDRGGRRRGGRRAAAASSSCRPAPARRSSPSCAIAAGRPARPRRHADHRPDEPVVRRTVSGVRRAGRPARRRRTTTSSRSPSRPTTRPTSTWNAGATVRPAGLRRVPPPAGPDATPRRRSAASPRSASA